MPARVPALPPGSGDVKEFNVRTIRRAAVVVAVGLVDIALMASGLHQVEVQTDTLLPSLPGQIRLEGFLGHRIDRNREARLEKHITEYRLLEGFRERPGRQAYVGEHVGKWLDAAVLAYEYAPGDTELKAKIDRIARGLMDCQLEDGYLGTYLEEQRWIDWDVWVHKYDLIGLLSYYRLTRDPRALDACRRIADLLIRTFNERGLDMLTVDEHGGMASTSVLEPVCRLYEYTGEPRYKAFCEYIIRTADDGFKLLSNIEKFGTVHEVGNKKAYEMMSNYLGLIEYWRVTGERRGLDAAKLAWKSILRENRFITGGIDAHEVFSEPHTLETTGPCTETCVQVSWFQMNLQLLRITGDACYADEIHRHVYNHLTAAQHPGGVDWCYFTTMEGEKPYDGVMTCCGSSGPRAMTLIPTVACMVGADRLAVNLYESSVFRGQIQGVPVTLRQQTDYPWHGQVQLRIEVQRPVTFELQLLIPSLGAKAAIREEPSIACLPGQYASLRRTWSGTTSVHLDLEMPVVAHERDGRWALSRGPQILAFEDITNELLDGTDVIPDVSRLDLCECREAADVLDGSPGGQVVMVPGKSLPHSPQPSRPVTLIYRPYSEAGSAGGNISIYLPRAKQVTRPSKENRPGPPRIPGALFEASRSGQINGSFVDGDERSNTLTHDGEKREVDWFAALYPKPIRIDRVIFIHGRFLPGGGWWVTRRNDSAKDEPPAIEIRRTPGGPWERIAFIEDYPKTTSSDRGEVQPHAMFVTPVHPPIEIVGVRVVGVPSSGNDPSQNLVSCAELDVRIVRP